MGFELLETGGGNSFVIYESTPRALDSRVDNYANRNSLIIERNDDFLPRLLPPHIIR